MKMKMIGLLAGMISIGAIGAASAADMAVKAAPPPPPPLPSWTGFYIGGDVGGAWADSSGTAIFTDPFAPAGQSPIVTNGSFNRSGFIGGFYAGYNWQFSPNWVFGIEGDWSWTDRNGGSFCGVTSGGAAGCIDNTFGFVRVDANNDWIATLRGRLGYTWGSVMLYGTGGAAWVNNSVTLTADCRVAGCGALVLPGQFASATFSNTRTGWVAGLGLEWMITPNWLIRGEWLHVDVGNSSGVLNIPTGIVGTTQTVAWNRNLTIDIARFGIAYKFGWGQPVVARY
jgi:outer membrane immunogenic protein